MIHPDQSSAAFTPSQAWCIKCGAPIRIVGTRYWNGDKGPYCSTSCAAFTTALGTPLPNPPKWTWSPDGL